MKKRWPVLFALLCSLLLHGCAQNPRAWDDPDMTPITPVGQIPEAFAPIIRENLFHDAVAFDGCLLKAESIPAEGETGEMLHRVWMLDLYGNELASYTCTTGRAQHVTTLTATRDGGFLFVLPLSEFVDQNGVSGDSSIAARVIKCDASGKLQFDTVFPALDGGALRYCFEKDGRYYFFGTAEAPETKVQGVYSRTDVIMCMLDSSGAVLKTGYIAGSDYDSLDAVEPSGQGFRLSVSAQSDDGDFAGSDSEGYPKDWVFWVDDRLEITAREMKSGRDCFDSRLGEKNGAPVYRSDALLKGFDAGAPTALIDYGDFYLIVSENVTGTYEHTPPTISSIWHYTETVYSAYDSRGKLLFRAAVDSSPDYDAMAEKFWDFDALVTG